MKYVLFIGLPIAGVVLGWTIHGSMPEFNYLRLNKGRTEYARCDKEAEAQKRNFIRSERPTHSRGNQQERRNESAGANFNE